MVENMKKHIRVIVVQALFLTLYFFLFGHIGYRDIIAIPDLSTFRRIPWEHDIPFFLLSFYEPASREPLAVCPRGVLKRVTDQLALLGWEAMCGAEFEFFNFKGNKKQGIYYGSIMVQGR